MVNYNNAKIYKIVCNITGKCYIGSTCQNRLAQRLSDHKKDYKKFLNGKTNYVTSFEVIKNDNYDIILLEECENINTKDQLHARERFYIENNDCVNKNIPTRTDKEYYLVNKDRILEHKKQYRKDNAEKIKEQKKQYRIANKEKISKRKKQYRKDNAEKIKQYDRQYYLKKKAEKALFFLEQKDASQ